MRFISFVFMDINQIGTVAVSLLTTFGLKILGAIALWLVGQKLIVLVVRPYCNNDHYWQVYFDTNKTIRETFTQAEYPVPVEAFSLNGLTKGTNGGALIPS